MVLGGAAGMLAALHYALLAISAPSDALQQRLQAIATATKAKYNCSVGIGVQTSSTALEAAAGVQPSAKFVWGSVTKQATGATILQLAEDGVLKLDEPVYKHIDPMLKSLGLGSMTALFGKEAELITAEHLATMNSGVPDYDTAKPYPRPPTDTFRAEVYKTPAREFPPASLINQSWVATGELEFTPGKNKHGMAYSSTNFVLLGLLIAALRGAAAWDDFQQATLFDRLPADRKALYHDTTFASHGAPAKWTTVHGYDRTSYNGADPTKLPGTDVWNVAGVYGGWTASDLTASVADVARLGYDIHSTSSGTKLISKGSQRLMVPSSREIYGFATFNLEHVGITGHGKRWPDEYDQAYGHLGATYGYDSLLAYFPAIDVAISIGTSIETDDQSAPSDAMCLAYNAVLAVVLGYAEKSCQFVKNSYYGGQCKCK